ncbi:relaxase/mobilization nuclease domain-containing protein [[Clostridium] scindens]|uniref:relaxase/mobilization nuclease domain-containing protein n=1 Tax=Clostridium scindens (strain JCM 10418 / VPI 12708) TaxID=29347 RepID=UPI002675BDAA|nr:relaxase/mobilization nuclease domain-containing protein [[Clostridium] scindens]
MSDIRAEIVNELYQDPCSYRNTINYVAKNSFRYGGYGFYPHTPDDAAKEFLNIYDTATYDSDRNLWHFFISFSTNTDKYYLLSLANQIAFCFAPLYQIFYGLHTKTGHYHIHFIVNAYSYRPNTPPLDMSTMQTYMNQVKSFLSSQLHINDITLQTRKKGSNV